MPVRYLLLPGDLCLGPLTLVLHTPVHLSNSCLQGPPQPGYGATPHLSCPCTVLSLLPASFSQAFMPHQKPSPHSHIPCAPYDLDLTCFLSISWCQLRAHTQSQPPSVLITHQSCHHLWSAREALGTPDPHPSSEYYLRVERANGRGPHQLSPGLGEGTPSLPPPLPSPFFPAALMLVGAARRTWTMTQRQTPWCLPSGSGHAGGMAQSMVCLR